jgi:signal transduction histidine kinase
MKRLAPLMLVAAILLIWEAVARSGRWSPLLFPPLEKISRELILFFTKPESLMEAWVSLQRAFGGFALAAVAGVTIGMLMGRSAKVAALAKSAREAMVNAAKHAGGGRVDVYAEVADGTAAVYVRDRGRGFDPAAVADDRMGIRTSIVGRMERHGGTANVQSVPGDGTEITLTMSGLGEVGG